VNIRGKVPSALRTVFRTGKFVWDRDSKLSGEKSNDLSLRSENKEVFLLKTKERILKTKLRGAVLLLVMTVMFMLMIILMATLAVVSTSNKKAYVKFEENQAYYSAASALEVFWGAQNGTKGFMKDEKYYAMKPDGSGPQKITDIDGSTQVSMTQGRSIEMELYHLASIQGMDIVGNSSFYNAKITNGTLTDLKTYLQDCTDMNALGSALQYSKQFAVDPPINPNTEVAFYVEFPTIANPINPANGYGEYADVNPLNADPSAPVDDQPLQKAAIKMEVLKRFYNLDGVENDELIAFMEDDPNQLPVVPAPTAIADDTDPNKIDLNKVKTKLQAGDRARDYFVVRVTSESVLMGVKGTAAVEMVTTIPVSAAPNSDSAVKSFGFTKDGNSGYNAIGGATGLADVKLGTGQSAGTIYSSGNISFGSSRQPFVAEDTLDTDKVIAKANAVSKSWVVLNKSTNLTTQGSDAFIYAYRGINATDAGRFMVSGGGKLHLITDGPFLHATDTTVSGNLVVGEMGKAGTFQSPLVVNEGVFVRDLYVDDIKTDGTSDASTRFGRIGQDKFKVNGNSGVLFVENLYFNFPANKAAAAPGATSGGATASLNPSADTSFGYYDFFNSGEGGNPGPIGIKTNIDAQNQWVINLGMTGVSKIVFTGLLYFRNYNGTADPSDDWYSPRTYDSVKDYITFLNTDTFINANALLNGPATQPANQYYSYNDLLKINGTYLYNPNPLSPETDPIFTGNVKNAHDINTDVNNAIYYEKDGINYRLHNSLAIPAEISANIARPQDYSYAFDTETGNIWLRMPFSLPGAASDNFLLKFDTELSLYKDYMDLSLDPQGLAKFNIADPPTDKNADGYLSYDMRKAEDDRDIVGYGSISGRYLGAYTQNGSDYVLEDPDDYEQSHLDGNDNTLQKFGYLSAYLDGSFQWGLTDLIKPSEERANIGATGVVFDIFSMNETPHEQQAPSPVAPTRNVPSVTPTGPSIGYTKLIDTSGEAMSSSSLGGNFMRKSMLNIIDATSMSNTIILTPDSSNIITGTYIVDGDSPTNFYIRGNQGTVYLGNNQQESFYILSSKHMKNFNISSQVEKNPEQMDSNNLKYYKFGSYLSSFSSSTPFNAGIKTPTASRDYCSKITLYIGEGTDIILNAGTIDGTVYGPLSSFGTATANYSQGVGVSYNGANLPNANSVAVIGTVICGNMSFNGEQGIIYLPPDPNGGADPGIPNFTWKPTLYTANASGS
jgi:hypothetical protein